MKNKSKYNPLVSILIPVYNSATFFEQTIVKNLEQSYKNIEYIIHDDCSTDNTYELLKNLANKDERITIIKPVSNCGLGQSRNNLLNAARGEFVFFIDDDDRFVSKKSIEKCVKKLDPNTDIMATNFLYKLSFLKKPFFVLNFVKSHLKQKNALKYYSKNTIYAWANFYRLNFLKENNIQFLCRNYEDMATMGHIFSNCKNFKSTEKNTIIYNRVLSRISKFDNSFSNKLYQIADAYKINLNVLKQDFEKNNISMKLQEKVFQSLFMQHLHIIASWYFSLRNTSDKKAFSEFINNKYLDEIKIIHGKRKIKIRYIYNIQLLFVWHLFKKWKSNI
ncbi:glycosyltransferase family 2 protein [Mycoplasma crocodyli]|uniref:Glycosyltransferase n=1 Tax=Mycoplasma crocodyli (strain ATCC 51981 / MP145) TaxID=512564 RepID=D5E571_MYCCM|nr:glycosyltransferase family 2 protein [Mycoplasma crocodyli]ADE19634.1 glycosyltransferase [Mycoplasma crocodyli MP145]